MKLKTKLSLVNKARGIRESELETPETRESQESGLHGNPTPCFPQNLQATFGLPSESTLRPEPRPSRGISTPESDFESVPQTLISAEATSAVEASNTVESDFGNPHQILISVEAGSAAAELRNLEKEMEEINAVSEKLADYVMRIALVILCLQVVILFWLYTKLSWNSVEPIAFFGGCCYFILGFAFFNLTSMAPTFQSFRAFLVQIFQKMLMARRKFDFERYNTLKMRKGDSLSFC